MSQEEPKNIGGSVEQALSGQTPLNLQSILKQGWDNSSNNRAKLLQGGLFTLFVGVVIILLLQSYFQIEDWQQAPLTAQLSLNILITVLSAPMVTALTLMGIAQSIGMPSLFFPLLTRLLSSALLILLALLITALVDLGTSFFILPGLYISMASGFALVLLVDKKYSSRLALFTSIKVFNRYWKVLASFYLMFFVLFIASFFTFGLALIWVMPWYFNCKGVIYRDLFGISVDGSNEANTSENGDFYA